MKWTVVQEQALQKLAEQTRGLNWLHMRTMELLERDLLIWKISLTILIISSFVLTVLDDMKQDVVIGIFRQLTLFASQLAVLYKLYVGDTRIDTKNDHKSVATDYLKLSREAEKELQKPRDDRERVATFMKRVNLEYDRLLNSGLTPNRKAIAEFKEMNAHTGVSLPLVVGGVDQVLVNVYVEDKEAIVPKTYAMRE